MPVLFMLSDYYSVYKTWLKSHTPWYWSVLTSDSKPYEKKKKKNLKKKAGLAFYYLHRSNTEFGNIYIYFWYRC